MFGWPQRVIMARNDSGAWIVMTPWGVALDVSQSQSQGLQEAINYAVTNGMELQVIGGMDAVIVCNATISFPPLWDCLLELGSVHLDFQDTVTGPGLLFDTIVHSTVIHRGNITYRGNEAIIRLQPHTNFRQVPTCVDSKLEFLRIRAIAGINPMGIHIIPARDGFRALVIDVLEIEGRTYGPDQPIMGDGVVISHPGGNGYCLDNVFNIARIKGCYGASIRVGETPRPALSTEIGGNVWRVGSISPACPTALGLSTWARHDRYELGISALNSPFGIGIRLEESAAKNLLLINRNDATTHKVFDNSISRDNLVISSA